MNSVLDDNKKLTLNTGETIKLSPSMNILIEAENLSSCTPATISRCGMIYMQEENISVKALFNKWLKTLPDTIEENLFEIENMCQWFFPEILNLMKPNNLMYPCSHKWLVLNFTRLFDALIRDYHNEKYNNINQNAFNVFDGQKEAGSSKAANFEKNKKTPLVSFADIESRYLNSINYKNLWIEAFFVFSLVWSFGYMLKPHLLKDFNRIIKKKIIGNKEELPTVAQLKSKLRNDHVKRYQEFEPSPDFIELKRPPYFLLPFPNECSIFDIVYDLETNSWVTFESIKDEFPKSSDNELKKKSDYYNIFIQSEESIKYSYLIAANALSNKSILLIGPTGCGKSWLARDVCFNYLPQISQKFRIASVAFSHNTDSKKAQNFFDSRLDRRRKNVYGPPFGINYIFYIDDLMMPATDDYGVKSANELIRQWFDYNGWYDHRTLEHSKIEDIQFIGCITTYGKFNQ